MAVTMQRRPVTADAQTSLSANQRVRLTPELHHGEKGDYCKNTMDQLSHCHVGMYHSVNHAAGLAQELTRCQAITLSSMILPSLVASDLPNGGKRTVGAFGSCIQDRPELSDECRRITFLVGVYVVAQYSSTFIRRKSSHFTGDQRLRWLLRHW